ncbi:unannotated protein [freshwater metagenome]|uniref:Unannotated protein n=1 Tax=freshwater metagenome TaxID=449393 RepID=A0A6J7ASP9_9ZZZZ
MGADDLGKARRARRRSPHFDAAVAQIEVGRSSLEQIGRRGDDGLAQRVRRAEHRAGCERRRSRSTGTHEVERCVIGVSGYDFDLAIGDAQPVGRQLRKRGVMALTVRYLARVHANPPVGTEARPRRLRATRRRGSTERQRVVLGPRCRFEYHRETDTTEHAARAGCGALGARRCEVDAIERTANGLGDVDVFLGWPRDHRAREIGCRDKVAEPHVDWVETEVVGDRVEQPLARERLGFPRTAIRDVAALVRREHPRVEAHVLYRVRTREQHAHERGDDRAGQCAKRIGALVDAHLYLQRADATVEIDGRHHVQALVARMARRGQVLGAVLDPLHRRAELARGVPDQDLLAHRVRLLPERAADVGAANRDRALVKPEQGCQRCAERVWVLERCVDGQVVIGPLG